MGDYKDNICSRKDHREQQQELEVDQQERVHREKVQAENHQHVNRPVEDHQADDLQHDHPLPSQESWYRKS